MHLKTHIKVPNISPVEARRFVFSPMGLNGDWICDYSYPNISYQWIDFGVLVYYNIRITTDYKLSSQEY